MTPRARTRRSGRSCRTCARSEQPRCEPTWGPCGTRGSRAVGCTQEAAQGLQEGTRLPACPRQEDDAPVLEALVWLGTARHMARLPAPISSPGTWPRCSCCRAPRRRRSRSCTCGWGSSHHWASSPPLPCSPAANDASPRAASTPPAATACSAWSWRSPQVPAPAAPAPSQGPCGLGGGCGTGTPRAGEGSGLHRAQFCAPIGVPRSGLVCPSRHHAP